MGFQWDVNVIITFDERIDELRAFKVRFGHCNVTVSESASNKPDLSLGRWCHQVRYARRLIEEGKPVDRNLCKAHIERLDALGFSWTPKKTLSSSS